MTQPTMAQSEVLEAQRDFEQRLAEHIRREMDEFKERTGWGFEPIRLRWTHVAFIESTKDTSLFTGVITDLV